MVIVGFTCSAFDLCHAGHVDMLRQCKEVCDFLIVGLQVDPSLDRPNKHKPIQTIVERYLQVSAVRYVDQVIPYQSEKDLVDLLSILKIDVRILGEEYRDRDFTGKEICEKRGISFFFNKRDHRFSSSELRNRLNEQNH